MRYYSERKLRGIVLAAGEGSRVRTFLQQRCGGRGIKQFCAVIGRRSMLEHTLARVERLIPRERILVIVSQDHQPEAQAQLAHWPKHHVIVQPGNRDTAYGVAPLLSPIPSEMLEPDWQRFLHELPLGGGLEWHPRTAATKRKA